MGARRKFPSEYKREAVAMLDAPGVTVSQIAADLGIGANMLGRWRRELRRVSPQAFVGNGRSRDEEVSQLRRELARVTKERDFLREAARNLSPEFRKRHSKVPSRGIMAMRNVLVHEYFGIDLPIVWRVVSKRIPVLKRDISKIMKNQEGLGR